MHLDDERTQRLIHGELTEQDLSDHLAVCAACQARVTDARAEEQEINALLQSLDHDPPIVSAEMLVQTARAGRTSGWGRWAAAILLAAGVAGAAYAVERIIESDRRSRQTPDSITQPPPPAPNRRGMGVAPGSSLVIMFAVSQTQGRVLVVLSDSADVFVEAVDGAVTFTSHVGRLLIDNAGSSADFEIHIPRTAPHVEIQVGNRRIFLKEGSSVVSPVPADASGAYLLPLAARGN
jgi:hypothetical protein